MSREEAALAAWRWTWRVRVDQMEEVLTTVMRSLTGAPLTVIGISNGAAVAAELASRVPVCSMWLASGVPAEVHGSASDAGKSVKRVWKRSMQELWADLRPQEPNLCLTPCQCQ